MGFSMIPEKADFLFTTEKPHCIYIKTWWCYINDIFLPWRGNLDQLLIFQRWLNARNKNVYFDLHANDQEINFLNIKVIKEVNNLTTILYKKFNR